MIVGNNDGLPELKNVHDYHQFLSLLYLLRVFMKVGITTVS